MRLRFPYSGCLVAALCIVLLPGCYIPGSGWTLRSGIDLRTYRKPALFTEMVDTRWDEWNRAAQANGYGGGTVVVSDPQGQSSPTALPNSQDLTPAEQPAATPRSETSAQPQSTPSAEGTEPIQVPGVPEKRPKDGPTAQSEGQPNLSARPIKSTTEKGTAQVARQGDARRPNGLWLFSRP